MDININYWLSHSAMTTRTICERAEKEMLILAAAPHQFSRDRGEWTEAEQLQSVDNSGGAIQSSLAWAGFFKLREEIDELGEAITKEMVSDPIRPKGELQKEVEDAVPLIEITRTYPEAEAVLRFKHHAETYAKLYEAKHLSTIESELSDVIIMAFSLARALGLNILPHVAHKMHYNNVRHYLKKVKGGNE